MQQIKVRHRRHRHPFVWGLLALGLVATDTTHAADRSPSASPRQTQLHVTSDPVGARIYLNNRMQDVTPVTLTNLPPGKHLVAAQLPGYHESRMTISLAPGERLPLDFKLDPITGLVLLHSVPPDADITVNGAHRGRTPLLLTDLPLGRHRAAAARPGYLPMEIEITIEDRTPQRFVMELRPDSANLRFVSTPAGADVYIDGILRGTTPCYVERVASGESDIEIRLDGHEPFRQRIQLQAGDELTLDEELAPLPGSLRLTSIPPGARIEIDGRHHGETPLTIDDLRPGRYRVRASHRGYADATAELTVRHAAVTRHEFHLQRNSGTIELTTEPAGVRVMIDGEPVGTTAPGESDVMSVPLTLDLIQPGTRTIQLSRPGYYPHEFQLQIIAGQTITRHERLRRRFVPDTRVRIGDGPNDVLTGIITQRHPDGSIEIETRPGIFRTLEPDRIITIDPMQTE